MPTDTEPPRVRIVSPAPDAVLRGRVEVLVDVSDNECVGGTSLLIDGRPFDRATSDSPYRIDWDTALTRNGVHTIAVQAHDVWWNRTLSEPVTVTVSNGPPTDAVR